MMFRWGFESHKQFDMYYFFIGGVWLDQWRRPVLAGQVPHLVQLLPIAVHIVSLCNWANLWSAIFVVDNRNLAVCGMLVTNVCHALLIYQ